MINPVMRKIYFLLLVLLPLGCFSQFAISGKIINVADAKPLANASVFIGSTTIGDKTAQDGAFTLKNIKPGKYDLVVSNVGFDTYSQVIVITDHDIMLPDIAVFSKTIALNEVKIKPHTDLNREKYYEWFKSEFLGTSERSKDCKVINPEVLNLDYDESADKLSASSSGFLTINNEALGYKISYLVADFVLLDKDKPNKKIYYKGSVLFEEMKGSPSQMSHWRENRQNVYQNSPMHFLRSAISNRITEEGFRVQQLAVYANPDRPEDSVINAKIVKYKNLKRTNSSFSDSLALWSKKMKLPKTLQKLMAFPLDKQDIIKNTDQPGQYALGCELDGLYVAYNKYHHYHIDNHFEYLTNRGNSDNTLLTFKSPYVFFDDNGVISNPYSVAYTGVWGINRVAELLPVDYQPVQKKGDAENSNTADSPVTRLDNFPAKHNTEKAYLHFDKPYYAAGDTIYFKAYVTHGEKHELSDLSGVLHVDLINTSNKVDQSVKLQLTNGVAWGDFALPDSLQQGNYRIRAYTRWMRNDGTEGFFDQLIPIGSIVSGKIPESSVSGLLQVNAKPDARFLPEGGSLVYGLRSIVAFKVVGSDGLGINIKGSVIDDENEEVCSFASSHLGMGYFYLRPQENKNYRAKVTYANGSQDIIDLPKAAEKGVVLTVNNDSVPQASVRVEVNKQFFLENKNKEFNLVIYSAGTANTVTFKLDSPAITLDVLKRRLHTGIATVTLFSPAWEPLCERLFFVQNYDQLQMDLISDKQIYSKREKVTMSLNLKDRADEPAEGHFSVSIIDESKVPVNENTETTIFTNLLLTSDLKGYVEQPNFYFANINNETQNDLDLIMLTHGYRKFAWKKISSDENTPLAYQPEKGLEISGIAEIGFKKPLVNGAVSLISSTNGVLSSQQTDDKGNFHFTDLLFIDSARFVLQAVTPKGKNSTSIAYLKDAGVSVVSSTYFKPNNELMPLSATYLESIRNKHDNAVKYGRANGIMLKEVKIREKKSDDDYPSSNLSGPGHADQVVHRRDFRGGGLFSDQFNGILKGVTFIRQGVQKKAILSGSAGLGANNVTPMLIMIDGSLVDGSIIDDINVNNIETIEVLKGANAAIYGFNSGAGVLIITTRKGSGLVTKDIASTGILPITVIGFYKAREFYSPKYEHPNNIVNRPDLRSTIYWKPEIQTDKDGNASFDYYNADGTGDYRVVIEGIDDKGNLGRLVYRYKVE